ncbi:MAG: GNAT family N-acetyltransferase [Anaerolineae bacterium]|nr:GNAT family N-acetyltransferase [Anaerolineae bacterium]MDW8171617.1 GNAT family N-acetyltransferase [Anaerolineae bacterium]
MTDMLVKLYALPPLEAALERQASQGISIRRAIAPEKHLVLAWVRQHFSEFWVSETDSAFANRPVSCWLAVEGPALIGFGCYDATAKGFFGPTGVSEAARGRGTGAALLIACLHDMRAQGYGYGIIGGVGPIEFYARTVGATVIDDSTPGVYAGMLRQV